MYRTIIGITALCLVASAAPASTVTYHRAPHIEVALRAEMQSLPRGQWVWIGIHQKLEAHWHTYWRNPGDSGLQPKMRWTLPNGVEVTPIHWPVPKRIRVKHLANYGYEDQVLLLMRLKVPADWRAGQITISGTFDWLVCQESCIPGKATLTRVFPVGDNAIPADSATRALFREARANLPVPAKDLRLTLSAGSAETLRLTAANLPPGSAAIELLPIDTTVVHNAAPQPTTRSGDRWILTLTKHGFFDLAPKQLRGLLVVTTAQKARRGYRFQLPLPGATPTTSPPSTSKPAITPAVPPAIDRSGSQSAPPLTTILRQWRAWDGTAEQPLGLWQAFLFALIGGLILNLMPCVFPVLSLKVLHFVNKASAEASDIRAHGVAFWLGIQASFSLLALLLVLLRAGGEQIGWGFQLQLPHVVFILMAVLFLLGLWLAGLFEFGYSVMNLGQSLTQREGYGGSFFTGVLAVVVATPCTAPLMGPPIAFALSQPIWVSLPLFNALGLGMALPYLLLSLFPRALRLLPRPGAWMERVKQFMAFPMFAAAIWLLGVLGNQAGRGGIVSALAALTTLALAAWIYGTTRAHSTPGRFSVIAGLIAIGAIGYGIWQVRQDARTHAARQATIKVALTQLHGGSGGHVPYTRGRLAQLLAHDQTVFINMTADWCISCKVNEKVALNRDDVQAAFKRRGIVRMVGDWTNKGAEIGRFLQHFKRSGVPLYILFHGPSRRYMILPQLLTQQTVLDALKRLDRRRTSQLGRIP